MPPAPVPDSELARLAALHAMEILDTPPDEAFDAITRLATRLCGTPIAAVTLVDAHRLWFKSVQGLDVREASRDAAFCAYTILAPDDLMVVPDATLDPRFADSPLVLADPHLRFYAGVPLTAAGHLPIGTLCVFDTKPRDATPQSMEVLRDLARCVSSAVELYVSNQRLSRLALTDRLTGLANRASFDMRLHRAVADGIGQAGQPPAQGPGVLLLDLDSFKGINDLFGHAGGDAALTEAAHRVRACARASDLVARLDGDEFAVLCPEVGGDADLLGIAARIHLAMADPFTLNGQMVALRTSIGVARGPADGSSAQSLLRAADVALNAAKRAGRSRTSRYVRPPAAPADDTKDAMPATQASGRHSLGYALHSALLPGGMKPFLLEYQPILRAADGTLAAVEALVRWPRPDGTFMQPGDFIPAAEASGLIAHLDRWGLREACRAAMGWSQPIPVAVNFSAVNFFLVDTCDVVTRVLRETGLPPSRLAIEVTETVLVSDPARAMQLMAELRALGVTVSLDDFGGGHGTLSYLRDYPFDEIKIDRTLVAQITSGTEQDQQRARAIIRAILALGQAMQVLTLAEGIETQAQLEFLRREGVALVQGFFLSRPLSASDLAHILDRLPVLSAWKADALG